MKHFTQPPTDFPSTSFWCRDCGRQGYVCHDTLTYYHGTRTDRIDSICRAGLYPSSRGFTVADRREAILRWYRSEALCKRDPGACSVVEIRFPDEKTAARYLRPGAHAGRNTYMFELTRPVPPNYLHVQRGLNSTRIAACRRLYKRAHRPFFTPVSFAGGWGQP